MGANSERKSFVKKNFHSMWENALDYLSAAASVASVASVYQATRLHSVSAQVDTHQHQEEMSLLREQQDQQIRTIKQTYLMKSFTDMERHFQQLNADLISGCKEFEKDMVDQRTIWCETIIIAATIMLASLIAVLVEGILPPGNNGLAVYLAFSISNAASLGCLFICTILYVIVVYRISNFTIVRSSAHTKMITHAFRQTKNLLGGMRNSRRHTERHPASSKSTPAVQKPPIGNPPSNSTITTEASTESYVDVEQGGGGGGGSGGSGSGGGGGGSEEGAGRHNPFNNDSAHSMPRHHVNISAMSVEDFAGEWAEHENLIHHFLDQRNEINDKTASIFQEKYSFGHFWKENCDRTANVGLAFFYVGTSLMLVAVMVYVWALFVHTYKCTIGAIITIVFISLSQIVGLVSLYYIRMKSVTFT